MENQNLEMPLVGFNYFNSKDKTQMYYVVQILYTEEDKSKGTKKGTLLNVFVDKNTYDKVIQLDIGRVLNVSVVPNLSTGKVNYKILI